MSGPQSTTKLGGLRPYTTYSVAIAVLSSGGESLPSEPLFNVTLEAGKFFNVNLPFYLIHYLA